MIDKSDPNYDPEVDDWEEDTKGLEDEWWKADPDDDD